MSFNISNFRKFAQVFALLTLGSLLYAFGVAAFIDPHNIAPGGITGIAVMINRSIGIELGLTIFLLNVPLLIWAFFRFKVQFTVSTIYSIVVISATTDLLSGIFAKYHILLTENALLGSIFGGIIIAIGIGLVFHANACTGGTDIIVKLLRQRFKHFKSGILFFTIDALIILTSAAQISIESALYATVCVIISSFVLDWVLYGPESAKIVYIISDESEVISKRILNEISSGVTFLEGEGAYTGTKRRVLMCVFRKHHYRKIREIVSSEDTRAFMIVSSAHEVFGEGFKNQFADEI